MKIVVTPFQIFRKPIVEINMKISLAKCFFTISCLCALSASFAKGQDIGKTPIPDAKKRKTELSILGYKSKEQDIMLDSKWAQKRKEDEFWARTSGWTVTTKTFHKNMKKAGYSDQAATVIINVCKVFARDPRHCIVMLGSVGCAESSCARELRDDNKNFFGWKPKGVITTFPSIASASKCWVAGGDYCAKYADPTQNYSTYNEKWFRANEGYFYGFCKVQQNPDYEDKNGHKYDYYCKSNLEDVKTIGFYTNKIGLFSNFAYCLSEPGSAEGNCPNGYGHSRTAHTKILENITLRK